MRERYILLSVLEVKLNQDAHKENWHHVTLNVQELYYMMSKLRLQYMIMREIHTRIGSFKDVTTHAS